MYFEHDAQIWQAFPQLRAGLLLMEGVDAPPRAEPQLERFFARARERLAAGPESELPEVSAWRRAYSQMGLKPTQYRSAAEALLRRFRREDALPALHPLVDLCNAVSLAFALPVAVIDLDGVSGFIEVRYARGDERYMAFSGEEERPDPGEVIFADADNAVHARRWTFRQSRQSTVSDTTRRALIVSEGMHASAAADVPALIDTIAGEAARLWGPPLGQTMLSAAEPRWDF
jgi:DNA/RNA-binding domain of Phe-tRNA-synthetase-like protein